MAKHSEYRRYSKAEIVIGQKDRAKVDALLDPENNLAIALQVYSIDRGPIDRFLDAAVICVYPPPGFKFENQKPHRAQAGRIVAGSRGSYMAPELTGSVTAAVAFAVQWAPVNWRIIVGNAAVQCRSPEWLARKIVQLTLEHLGK